MFAHENSTLLLQIPCFLVINDLLIGFFVLETYSGFFLALAHIIFLSLSLIASMYDRIFILTNWQLILLGLNAPIYWLTTWSYLTTLFANGLDGSFVVKKVNIVLPMVIIVVQLYVTCPGETGNKSQATNGWLSTNHKNTLHNMVNDLLH